jgi:hypothetical protein
MFKQNRYIFQNAAPEGKPEAPKAPVVVVEARTEDQTKAGAKKLQGQLTPEQGKAYSKAMEASMKATQEGLKKGPKGKTETAPKAEETAEQKITYPEYKQHDEHNNPITINNPTWIVPNQQGTPVEFKQNGNFQVANIQPNETMFAEAQQRAVNSFKSNGQDYLVFSDTKGKIRYILRRV